MVLACVVPPLEFLPPRRAIATDMSLTVSGCPIEAIDAWGACCEALAMATVTFGAWA